MIETTHQEFFISTVWIGGIDFAESFRQSNQPDGNSWTIPWSWWLTEILEGLGDPIWRAERYAGRVIGSWDKGEPRG